MKALPTFAQILCSATVLALTTFLYIIFNSAVNIIRVAAKAGLGVTPPSECLILLQIDEVLGSLWPLLVLALVAYMVWVRSHPLRMFVAHAIVSVVLVGLMLFAIFSYDKLIAATSTRAGEYWNKITRMKVDVTK